MKVEIKLNADRALGGKTVEKGTVLAEVDVADGVTLDELRLNVTKGYVDFAAKAEKPSGAKKPATK